MESEHRRGVKRSYLSTKLIITLQYHTQSHIFEECRVVESEEGARVREVGKVQLYNITVLHMMGK